MPIADWRPSMFTAVADAIDGAPCYEYLPEQPMEVPAVLFEPPKSTGQWPRQGSGRQDWTWVQSIDVLFARGADVIGSSDAQAQAWVEPIRRALAVLLRPGWPVPLNQMQTAGFRVVTEKCGFEKLDFRTIEWGGTTYHALGLDWRIVEGYFDPVQG